ncbi:hypothetical protein [Clostridium pasteurianum]|uniref:Uncharacterized protein n=1 Tax=Clostridium pasteurianum BC1 TaxID=86416 RepID=R4KD92_CLOPA|nr:hypothetical protein [Clostridium pasteurianum]AGK97585.1 hypothetical protein Clopa_2742 [Clostridium pasteurianum BC1]
MRVKEKITFVNNKHNFIIIKELKSQLENNKKEIETALEFVNQKLMHEKIWEKV